MTERDGTTTPQKLTLRDTIAQTFIDALSEDVVPWESMWTSQAPRNAVTNTKYRGINNLWLSFLADLNGYTDPRWCTFKQANAQGWQVRKGESAARVELWRVYDKQQRKYIDFSERDFIVQLNPERAKDMRLSSKSFCVFNAAQIDGIPELEVAELPDGDVVRAQRDTLIKNLGVGFREGGDKAFYRLSEDSVTMPPDSAFENSYAYMSTLLHECGHATGHESRLGRDLTGRFGSESYAKEELRAEISSAFVAQELGFAPQPELFMDNHKAYIQSWIQAIKDAPNELFDAINDAKGIADYLIEKGEFARVLQAEVQAERQTENTAVEVPEVAKAPADKPATGKPGLTARLAASAVSAEARNASRAPSPMRSVNAPSRD